MAAERKTEQDFFDYFLRSEAVSRAGRDQPQQRGQNRGREFIRRGWQGRRAAAGLRDTAALWGKSGGGPPQSKTLARGTPPPEFREASWTAPALWRLGRAGNPASWFYFRWPSARIPNGFNP
jgi:hypothetical protein